MVVLLILLVFGCFTESFNIVAEENSTSKTNSRDEPHPRNTLSNFKVCTFIPCCCFANRVSQESATASLKDQARVTEENSRTNQTQQRLFQTMFIAKYTHTYIYIYTHIYIYVYISLYSCLTFASLFVKIIIHQQIN